MFKYGVLTSMQKVCVCRGENISYNNNAINRNFYDLKIQFIVMVFSHFRTVGQASDSITTPS